MIYDSLEYLLQRKDSGGTDMRLLLLYGVNCTKQVWTGLMPYLTEYVVDYVEYPHELTQNATQVQDLTQWVYDTYHQFTYDAVIGHSLGGIIALELASHYYMQFGKIIYLDTNLRPAEEFYRNLMTPEHMEQFSDRILPMFQEQRKFYTPELFESLQKEFDYTGYLDQIPQKIYALYGDRNQPDYEDKVKDLNLSDHTLRKLKLDFIPNSCHMIMMENPQGLWNLLSKILND